MPGCLNPQSVTGKHELLAPGHRFGSCPIGVAQTAGQAQISLYRAWLALAPRRLPCGLGRIRRTPGGPAQAAPRRDPRSQPAGPQGSRCPLMSWAGLRLVGEFDDLAEAFG